MDHKKLNRDNSAVIVIICVLGAGSRLAIGLFLSWFF